MSDHSDSENTALMSSTQGRKEAKYEPDWGRFGLSVEQQQSSEKKPIITGSDYQDVDEGKQNELYREDQVSLPHYFKWYLHIDQKINAACKQQHIQTGWPEW